MGKMVRSFEFVCTVFINAQMCEEWIVMNGLVKRREKKDVFIVEKTLEVLMNFT